MRVAGLILCAAVVAAAPAVAADKVVLQLRYDHEFQFAGFYAADWQGYYAAAGLEVEIRSGAVSSDAILLPTAEVAEGRADFGIGGADILTAVADGRKLVLVASYLQKSGAALYARAGTPLDSVHDLVGPRLGHRPGAMVDIEMRVLLKAEGIDAAVVLDRPLKPGIEDLLDGTVDVIPGRALAAPWRAEKAGVTLKSISPISYGIDFYGESLFTTAELAERDPDLVARFADASRRGWEYALQNPEETADRIAAELPRVVPVDDPRGFLRFQAPIVARLMLYPIVEIGHTNPLRWQRMWDLMKQTGLVGGDLPLDTFIFNPERHLLDSQARFHRALMIAVAAVAAVALLAAIYGVALRRQVRARTMALSQAAAQARDWQRRYEAAANASGQVLFESDMKTGTLRWGGDIERVTGYPAEQLETFAAWRELLHADDRLGFDAAIRRAVAARTPLRIEYRLRRRDGQIIRVTDNADMLADSDGTVGRAVGFVADVSEQRAAEERLNQAQKMEVVGQLTGGVAHDFNNLLTVILGNSELIQEMLPKDSPLQDLAGAMRSAADQGAELTRRLLAFSRRQRLEPQVLDSNALIRGLLVLIRRTVSTTIQLDASLASDLWPIAADPGQLESALMHLVVNARDAMPKGGRLTIGTRNRPLGAGDIADLAAGDYVEITVADTGTGMSESVLAHVFEPFFTTKDVGHGSGLGLSMVHGFVHQTGGHVTIDSAPATGTTVGMLFPRAAAVAAQDAATGAGSAATGGGAILLVEDDAGVRATVSAMLRELGYAVMQAPSGSAGLDLLREGIPFDLLLSDMTMPGGVSGWDLAQAAWTLRPGLRIMLMTGHADPDLLHRVAADGRAAVLDKPFSRAALARKLSEALVRKTREVASNSVIREI